MKTKTIHFLIVAGASLLVILLACNLQTSVPSTDSATAPPVAESTDTTGPIAPTAAVSIPQPEPGTPVLWVDGSYVVYVPEGEFVMGKDETGNNNHSPAHTVNLSAFWIQQTEVTNRMYAQCVSLGICTAPHQETDTPYWYSLPGHASDPAVGVDWNQAAAYCQWIEGRLPTEAEWEKAARGTQAKPYPWGDDQPACTLLNYKDCFDPDTPVHVQSYPLGVSPFNLFDTAGNVFEWVNDRYAADYYAGSPSSNPTGPETGETRVFRSSAYSTQADQLELVVRNQLKPDKHRPDLGFRCVVGGETVANPPPPVCQVQALTIMDIVTATPPPPTLDRLSIDTFCATTHEGLERGVVNLDFYEPVTPDTYVITSSAGHVTISQEPAFPNILSATGAGIPLTMAFTLTICPALASPPALPAHPECPPGYSYDGHTSLCQFGHAPGEPFMCTEEAVHVSGFGCLPRPAAGLCPVGYFLSEYEGEQVCVPVGIPDIATLQDCLAGMTFDPLNQCCQLPSQTAQPACPAGYTLEGGFVGCVPGYEEDHCRTIPVYIAACPTPVPPCPGFCCTLTQLQCTTTYSNRCKWDSTRGVCAGP